MEFFPKMASNTHLIGHCVIFFQCSVSCDKGTMSRTIECQSAAGQLLDEAKCDAAVRPYETQPCNNSPCPTTTPKVTTETPKSTTELSLSWTTGSWTQVCPLFIHSYNPALKKGGILDLHGFQTIHDCHSVILSFHDSVML